MASIQRFWRIQGNVLNLIATKCSNCGYVSYPPKAACPKCGSRNVEEIKLPGRGRVVTYTVINVPIKGFEDSTPLLIAIVEINNARIMCQLVGIDENMLKKGLVGLEVEAVVRRGNPTLDNAIPYIIKFKPASQGR
ncbi:MAG: transcriptional regulator [Desulfurococcales archaeon ex4484_204]|nr:MAG: transcriptional regulator [Desulfurococcales archaeon ex4484_204]